MNRRTLFSTLAGGALGIGGFLAGRLSNSPIESSVSPVTAANRHQNSPETTVYYSSNTGHAYPIVKTHIGKWINGTVSQVLVLSASDIEDSDPILSQYVSLRKRNNKEEVATIEVMAFAEQNDVFNRAAQALRHLLDKQFPEMSAGLSDEENLAFATNLIYGGASTTYFSTSVEHDRNDAALISTDYPRTSKLIQAAQLSGLPLKAFPDPDAIPGTDEDWDTATFAHEIGHLLNKELSGLHSQISADNTMVRILGEMQKDEVVQSKDLFTFWQYCRDIKIIDPNMSLDATGAAIGLPKLEKTLRVAGHKYLSSLKGFQDQVANYIGSVHSGIPPMLNLYDDVLIGNEPFSGMGKIQLLSSEGKIIEDIINIYADLQQDPSADGEKIMKHYERIDDNFGRLSSQTQGKITEAQNEIHKAWGFVFINRMPIVTYKTIADLYQQNGFDDNPIGKRYAYRYLIAGQKAFPDYFKADRKQKFEPPGEVMSSSPAPAPQ